MSWKKILETKDVITYEKKNKRLTVRIEARYLGNNDWVVFKRYFNGKDINYTEEYYANSKDDLKKLLKDLRSGREPTIKELRKKSVENTNELLFRLERVYKTNNVEKWNLIHNFFNPNFVIINWEEDKLYIDLILHKKLKYLEEKIINFIENSFGIGNFDGIINYNVVYHDSVNMFTIDNEMYDDYIYYSDSADEEFD